MAEPKQLPPLSVLDRLFDYDHIAGTLKRKVKTSNSTYIGEIVNTYASGVRIDNVPYIKFTECAGRLEGEVSRQI
jgi:hypothetical protein